MRNVKHCTKICRTAANCILPPPGEWDSIAERLNLRWQALNQGNPKMQVTSLYSSYLDDIFAIHAEWMSTTRYRVTSYGQLCC